MPHKCYNTTYGSQLILPIFNLVSSTLLLWFDYFMGKVFHFHKISLAKIFSNRVKLPSMYSLDIHQESLPPFSGLKSCEYLAYA